MRALNDLTRQEWASMSTKVTQDAYNLLWYDYIDCQSVISESLGLLRDGSINAAKHKLEEHLRALNETYNGEFSEEGSSDDGCCSTTSWRSTNQIA